MSGHRAPEAETWSENVARADGYVIVTPEYNHGYPAVLKNALDHLYTEWTRKPVAFVGYGGLAGGVRSIEQLRQVVVELQMAPIRYDVVIPRARRVFADGAPADEVYASLANRMLDQLAWWARALKQARADDANQETVSLRRS